jgi:hypothetical protein
MTANQSAVKGFPNTKEEAKEAILEHLSKKENEKVAMLMAYFGLGIKDPDLKMSREQRNLIYPEMKALENKLANGETKDGLRTKYSPPS